MKRILFICLALLLLVPGLAAAEQVIYDKTEPEYKDFEFEEGTPLLEIFFPKIYGVDSALVRYGDYTMLIDCAGNQRRAVQDLLDDLGVTELTYALNSHPDADHIGGFDRVLKKVPAGEFLLGFPEDYPSGDAVRLEVYDALHEYGVPFRRVHHGETIEFGDVKMTVYQRTDEHLPRVNNKSVMMMIEYGERRLFFTGDIQRDTQLLLAADAENLDLKADIMKFPHHGYGNMQDGFLDMVDPAFVVCTCGENNTDGIKQLKEKGIPYILAAKGLRLATDGKVWSIERLK
ncbi:MAG: MBL fold metallo-hydrolase [Kiritimatiellae bacterium]|nr:MBL fold metallo-hydrolase [Kiritimatiellia bacterium]